MTPTTDKELLELAARAAGYSVHGWIGERFVVNFGDGERGPWRPLTDDGDALRLAVKLGLIVWTPDEDDPTAVAQIGFGTECTRHLEEVGIEQDAYAATRRAIVRAAASMAVSRGDAK